MKICEQGYQVSRCSVTKQTHLHTRTQTLHTSLARSNPCWHRRRELQSQCTALYTTMKTIYRACVTTADYCITTAETCDDTLHEHIFGVKCKVNVQRCKRTDMYKACIIAADYCATIAKPCNNRKLRQSHPNNLKARFVTSLRDVQRRNILKDANGVIRNESNHFLTKGT